MVRAGYVDFSIPWSGWEADPEGLAVPLPEPFGYVIDGRLFGSYSPVFPLLSSWPWRWFGVTGLYLLPLIGGVLTLAGVWRLTVLVFGDGPGRRMAPALAIAIVAWATPLWFYSMTFWEHTPAVACTTWALVFLLRGLCGARACAWRAWVMCGVLCGLAIWFRDELYVFAAAVGVTVGLFGGSGRARRVGVFAAGLAVGLGPLWVFQAWALGNPLGLHFQSDAPWHSSLASHLIGRGSVAWGFLVGRHGVPWASAVLAVPCLLLWLVRPRFSARWFSWGVGLTAGVALVSGAAVWAGFLTARSPIWWMPNANAVLAVTPVLMLGLIRPPEPDRARDHNARGTESKQRETKPSRAHAVPGRFTASRARTILGLFTLGFVVLYVLATPTGRVAGLHWGCRFLLPVVPALAALAATTMAIWFTRFAAGREGISVLLVLAMVVTVGMQVYAISLLFQRKRFSEQINRIVAARPERVVLAMGWFVPQELAHCFYDKQVFLIGDPRTGPRIEAALAARGVTEAVLVAYPPTPDAGRAGGIIYDDGPLHFLSIEVRPIHLLSPRPDGAAGGDLRLPNATPR